MSKIVHRKLISCSLSMRSSLRSILTHLMSRESLILVISPVCVSSDITTSFLPTISSTKQEYICLKCKTNWAAPASSLSHFCVRVRVDFLFLWPLGSFPVHCSDSQCVCHFYRHKCFSFFFFHSLKMHPNRQTINTGHGRVSMICIMVLFYSLKCVCCCG